MYIKVWNQFTASFGADGPRWDSCFFVMERVHLQFSSSLRARQLSMDVSKIRLMKACRACRLLCSWSSTNLCLHFFRNIQKENPKRVEFQIENSKNIYASKRFTFNKYTTFDSLKAGPARTQKTHINGQKFIWRMGRKRHSFSIFCSFRFNIFCLFIFLFS